MDLKQRTLETLDWPVVLSALAGHARTHQGAARAAEPEFVDTAEAATVRYAAVAEVLKVPPAGRRGARLAHSPRQLAR